MGSQTEVLKQLCKSLGRNYVGFRGSPNAPIWIVGEAPGADEDQVGVPFVGKSGKELDRMLTEAGINQNEYCCINPYTVRPPENDIKRIEETGIKREQFLDSFWELLSEHSPRFLCPVGGVPLEILCPDTIDRKDRESKISKWRGSLLRCPESRLSYPHYVLPNFHPAYILREWSDRDVAVFVFRKLREEVDFFNRNGYQRPLPSRELITNASFFETKEFLDDLLASDKPISCDFELLARCVPYTLALSNDPLRAISIELFGFRSAFTCQVWRLLDKILSTKHIVGQNWSTFDSNWATALGLNSGIGRLDDTLVMHHVLYPEMSHKLEFLGMQFTREPYWKDEGKGWRAREGIAKLKRYNCLDAACTLEAYQAMSQELDERGLRHFYNYEMSLARKFHEVDKRGLLTDQTALKELRSEVIAELGKKCVEISQELGGRPVVYSAPLAIALGKQLGCDYKQILNISSVPQLKGVLQNDLKIQLKKDRKTGRESTGEEALQDAFAKTQNITLKHILRTRELNKVLGTYIDTKLCNNVFYSCYSVTGTITGRRASRKNFLGFGSNGQNQPKHSDLGKKFRGVFVSRPGKIFVTCDQSSAEDWIVQGIIADCSGDLRGIEELRAGVDRHRRLASQVFGLPIEQCGKDEHGNDTIHRYLGKKTRHAGNYGMRENKMSAVLAAEGFSIPPKLCKQLLDKFHQVEPGIEHVFHKYVEGCLKRDRVLRTPLGRERMFYGLRPYGDNGEVFRDAYSYIPQSSVGDNTGMAILYCEEHQPGFVIQDIHDAILGEASDDFESVVAAMKLLERAFDRTFKFEHGFEVKIPIDFQFGYSLKGLKKCPSDMTSLRTIYDTLATQRKVQLASMNGALLQPSVQSSNEMSGLIA